jgi:hypothetical protein
MCKITIGNNDICDGHPSYIKILSFHGLILSKIIYLYIPSDYVTGEIVKITIPEINKSEWDLMEIVYDCLEHEIMHYVLWREFGENVSKSLDHIHMYIRSLEGLK